MSKSISVEQDALDLRFVSVWNISYDHFVSNGTPPMIIRPRTILKRKKNPKKHTVRPLGHHQPIFSSKFSHMLENRTSLQKRMTKKCLQITGHFNTHVIQLDAYMFGST